ncbi:MAG: GTP cyclohydrolase II [Rhodospirillales bacterium]|nr:MAG: GTP cyclohydrolase II [Rhodospirillales bacterium]
MSPGLRLIPVPATRQPLSLLTVDRAVADLRRGQPVVIQGPAGSAAVAVAAEGAVARRLDGLRSMAQSEPDLVVTARRGAVLGLCGGSLKVMVLKVSGGLTPELVRDLSDPRSNVTVPLPFSVTCQEAPAHGCASAAIKLCKTARLLPASAIAEVRDPDAADLAQWAARRNLFLVDAGDVFQYDHIAAQFLTPVGEARVPLQGAEQTRIIAFRPQDGGLEHLALVFGSPTAEAPVLTRLHSECFTGDLLGSLRCDCGDQLRGAIQEINGRGDGGVLLYLAQEGRGIGLVNKLRAYTLQDNGFDTVDANEQLGFDADERVYLPAAQMLRHLGFSRVRLLTNNPAKVDGLMRCGISVEERVPHTFPSNQHNEVYLRTKVDRGGHFA